MNKPMFIEIDGVYINPDKIVSVADPSKVDPDGELTGNLKDCVVVQLVAGTPIIVADPKEVKALRQYMEKNSVRILA
jgi:hypothetical protein